LASPYAGIEEWCEAEGLAGNPVKRRPETDTGHHHGGLVAVDVQHEVDCVEEAAFVAVGGPPFDEEPALVLAEIIFIRILCAPIRFPDALSFLNLPP